MPDIAMCSGTLDKGRVCPKAGQCYRHTAKPSPGRQSWFAVPPVKDDGTCEHYWPNALDAGTQARQCKP